MTSALHDGARRVEGPLTEDDAAAHIHGICFKIGPPERVGVELEWLVHDARDPALPVGLADGEEMRTEVSAKFSQPNARFIKGFSPTEGKKPRRAATYHMEEGLWLAGSPVCP